MNDRVSKAAIRKILWFAVSAACSFVSGMFGVSVMHYPVSTLALVAAGFALAHAMPQRVSRYR